MAVKELEITRRKQAELRKTADQKIQKILSNELERVIEPLRHTQEIFLWLVRRAKKSPAA